MGETIYPETNDCYKCKCAEDYDNKTAVHENKNCNKINCGIELHNLKEITEGCVPLYFGEKSCCPIGTLCRMYLCEYKIRSYFLINYYFILI